MKPASLTRALIVAAALATPAARPQTINPSAREILNTERALLPSEIAIVLEAARRALDGKTFRLSYQPGGPGPEILIGPNGRPRFMRAVSGIGSVSAGAWSSTSGGASSSGRVEETTHVDIIAFTDYTGRAARKCDGSPLEGELVIEYEHRSDTDRWTAKSRARTPQEFAGPLFDDLAGATTVVSGERRQFGNRTARALVGPFTPPGVPASGLPSPTTQSLWIDTESLLPLRWAIPFQTPPDSGLPPNLEYGLSFTYAELDLRPPDGIAAPDCIR